MFEKLIPPTIKNSSVAEHENFWRRAVEMQKKSRLTISGFCIAHGISCSEFKRWRIRFKNEASQPQNSLASKTMNLPQGESSSSPAFLPLRVDSSSLASVASEPTDTIIELRVGEKFSLPLTSDFDEKLLRRILTTLEGVS